MSFQFLTIIIFYLQIFSIDKFSIKATFCVFFLKYDRFRLILTLDFFLSWSLSLHIVSFVYLFIFSGDYICDRGVDQRSTAPTARWRQRRDPPSCTTRNAHQSLVGWRWVCVCARLRRNSEWTEAERERGVTERAFSCHRRTMRIA